MWLKLVSIPDPHYCRVVNTMLFSESASAPMGLALGASPFLCTLALDYMTQGL